MDTLELTNKLEKLSSDIMLNSRNQLIVNLRFMDSAISHLYLQPAGMELAVDGRCLYYQPLHVLELYKKGKNYPTRHYLHAVLHCVFRHFYIGEAANRVFWDLACDITVEHIINELGLPCLETDYAQKQKNYTARILPQVKMLTAEKLYRFFLQGGISPSETEEIQRLFRADDHAIWYEKGEEDSSDSDNTPQRTDEMIRRLMEEWKDISEKIQTDMETFSKQWGDQAGCMTQNLREVNRERYDYAEFLKKFAIMGESMVVNEDEFDYIFYTYGLHLYERMPLIEPLEYKEVKKVKEFVIAIDTSGSTSGDLVQKFLQKTYNILLQQENFFTKVNIHIIQCDAKIHEDRKITCPEEFRDFMETLEIKGGGGTDFRPVFEYVNELTAAGEFFNLRGLIYFTDGYGVFPKRQPDYHTAFVFIDGDFNNYDVPVWAIKLILQPEDL